MNARVGGRFVQVASAPAPGAPFGRFEHVSIVGYGPLEIERGNIYFAAVNTNPADAGRTLLGWLLHPISVERFYAEHWQKKPLVRRRGQPGYYDGWFSSAEMDAALRESALRYGEDLTVTRYDGARRVDYGSLTPPAPPAGRPGPGPGATCTKL